MSSQPEDGWHGGSGSGDGQAPPARNAAGDAVFPNPSEPIQGAEGVLPATAPAQRTSGAMGPRHSWESVVFWGLDDNGHIYAR